MVGESNSVFVYIIWGAYLGIKSRAGFILAPAFRPIAKPIPKSLEKKYLEFSKIFDLETENIELLWWKKVGMAGFPYTVVPGPS